jgi:hypothetical protein
LVLRVFHEKQRNADKIQMFKMQCGVVCWSLLQGVPHTIAFLKMVWHYAGKSGTQNARTVIILLLAVCLLRGNLTNAYISYQSLLPKSLS